MSGSSAMESCSQTIGIGSQVWALTFIPNGEHLFSGGSDGRIQVWRVNDGERIATMKAPGRVECVAVSKDGKYIAAGSEEGDVMVWDAVTYEQVFVGAFPGRPTVCGVDFSPDSKRLVSADGDDYTATIWDIALRQKVHTFHQIWPVYAAKYSPQGDRIATAAEKSVRVYSNDGRLLVDVRMRPDAWGGLPWLDNHLFVKTEDDKIRQIDASTGSTVSEWLVPHGDYACIALPQHGKFVAYSTENNITFWDTSTHIQLGLIPQRGSRSIAFSEDDRLAIAVERKILIKNIYFIEDPGIRIESAPLHAWKEGRLTKAEALLTAIPRAKNNAHHVLASRALVRACLRQWDAALVDAEESIELQSSVFGYIAKCVALVGKGEIHKGCRVCDIASLLFQNHAVILLLIKAVVLFMARGHGEAISRIDDLIAVRPLDPTLYMVQAYMLFLLGNMYAESGDYHRAIRAFEGAQLKLGGRKERSPLIILLISGWKFDDLAITIQLRLCEALLSVGRTTEASESVLRIVDRETDLAESVTTWVSDFRQRCLSTPEKNNSASSVVNGRDNVSRPIMRLFREWARLRLTSGSWEGTLAAATGFILPRFIIYQVICEHLKMAGHVVGAVLCFHQMSSELAHEMDGERVNWTRDFKSRCCGILENLGDTAINAKQYDEAILQYTAFLSLNPATTHDVLVKRSTALVAKGKWDGALSDANEVIRLDPSSPLGYERRHAALHGMGRYGDATHAFEVMLLKMSKSPDPDVRERSCHYVTPEKMKEMIRSTIEDIIRDSPPVLIHTISGRLCNKSEQIATFELTPSFTKLISSVTTHADRASIAEEVEEYFRYVMFSHKWEDNEPLFEKVIQIVVYDLEASPTHEKLQMFCKIVREAGFHWAWSDTCCINKGDHFVLQEALVSMFKWYERSAMTFIYLRGVPRLALRGALTKSLWNMRAWTLQEYHASKVVRIYTEDWTPYLGLEIYNHKESPEIISEMEEATGISAQALQALRPGLDDIREKLRLASTRQTTRVEDAAYSLLGIFSLSLPITYGEGDKALGRLLAQLLTSSGDASILAWTGGSGTFNSCLPSNIAVFNQPLTSHIPSAIPKAEMRTIAAGLRSLNLSLGTDLYERLNGLSVPLFVGRRMKLPCLSFKLGQVSVSWNGSERVFRAQTNVLGVVEIHTQEDLTQLGSLRLVHPWIDFLLNRQPVGNATIPMDNLNDQLSMLGVLPSFSNQTDPAFATLQTRTARLVARLGRSLGGRSTADITSLMPPSTVSPSKKQARVLKFIARLRRPFSALLLTPIRRNVDEYRRVAAESLITVQVEEITPAILDKLIQGVRTLDVL